MGAETFAGLVFVSWLIALGPFTLGLMLSWPTEGRGWQWRWALLWAPSAAVLALGVAFVAAFTVAFGIGQN